MPHRRLPDARAPRPARPTAALALAAALAAPRGLAAQVAPAAPAAPGPALTEVGFDSGRWTFVGGPATREVVGRDTVWTVPGLALLAGVDLADGVVEFDAYSAGYPSAVFRAASAEEHERVYLRTVRSGRPDALQYAPVARGFVGWRLYPEGEAAARFDPAHRNHVRVEFRGGTARVYVNGAPAPSLVTALRRPARGGAVGVGTVIGPQRFAHFRYAALPPAA